MTARLTSSLVLAALLALAGTSAFAQHGPAPASKPAAEPAPAPEAAVDPTSGALVETAPAAPGKDAKIEHLVAEDSQVKIEETRVRGVTKKIVVHSKITGGSYEIQPKDPSRAPDQDHGAGMRTFSFGF
jgi:glucose/arabinose dehydrogenase